MNDLQGGLNLYSGAKPIEADQPQEDLQIEQPVIKQPAIKEPTANLQDKALSDIEAQRAALNNQIKNMVSSFQTRSSNQLFDPKLMALASGLLAPTKTGGFGESLGAGFEKMSTAASQEEKERQENAKMRLEMMSTGLSLQEKQLAQDLMGRLYKTDKDGNPTDVVDPEVAAKLAKLTGDPKYQQMVVADLKLKQTREAFNKIFPTTTITNPDGTTKEITNFNPAALKDIVKASADPAKTLGELTDTVKKMRQNGMLGDNSTKDTPFDTLTLFAKNNPAIQAQAKYYADKYKAGMINDEEADKYAKSLMDLYEKDLSRADQNVFKQLMYDLRKDQQTFQHGQQLYQMDVKKAEKVAALNNTLTNLDLITNQVEHVKTHPGRYNGMDFGIATKYIPGTDAKDYVSAVETLKSESFLNQVSQMKGMGALSDAEGKKIQSALANLDVAQSKVEFDRNLKVITDTMNAAKQRQIKLAGSYGITNEDLGLGLNQPGEVKNPPAANIADQAKKAFGSYDPTHYDYRVTEDGTVQRKKK